jgi:GTP-binding protein Era
VSPAHAGFAAICGRPNVGKSTLINAIVGAKVAIVSDKPQTTRRAVRGVASGADWQLVLVDLPGVQRPRDELTGRMQRRVERELADADSALVVVNAEQGVGGPGDRFIASLLSGSPVPVAVAVNKVDAVRAARVAESLAAAEELFGPDAEYFPVSARKGTGVAPLVEHLVSLLPAGPYYFDPGERSDQPDHVAFAELVREQVLSRTRQEVPHAVEVEVEEIDDSREDLVVVRAHVWVETDSQKGIVIGAGGRMIKQIGTGARRQLERRLGRRVHLDLSVRVRRHWRDEARLLDRLGIE